MKNLNVIIIILFLVAVFFGGYIAFKEQSLPSLEKSTWSDYSSEISTSSTQEVAEEGAGTVFIQPEEEFTIGVGENTKIFGIDPDNPYIGEPPISKGFEGESLPEQVDGIEAFEIWGDVAEVDYQRKIVSLVADYPREISSEFTPRGPRLSLEDIRGGVRIIVSGYYDESGETDLKDIEFIQVIDDDIHRTEVAE